MQAVLMKLGFGNQIKYGYKRISPHRAAIKRQKYYLTRPDLFKRVSDISHKIDFKSESLKFPITVPLKFKWIYRPDKYLIPDIKQHDHVDFRDMTGNQILLHLENASDLRLIELLNALAEVAKRDPTNQLNLKEHPWVQGAFEQVKKKIMYFNQNQFTYLMKTYHRLGVEDPEVWQMFEFHVKKFLPRARGKAISIIFNLAFLDGGKRSSKEFRQELAVLLPIHLRNLHPSIFGQMMKQIYDQGFMTERLFEYHFHQVLWKRTEWIAQYGQLPLALSVLRDMKYENDEYLYPDLYRKLNDYFPRIRLEYLDELQNALKQTLYAFPSHQQYHVTDLIRKIIERIQWETSTGGAAQQISLVQIVQNDLKEYAENHKRKLQEQLQE